MASKTEINRQISSISNMINAKSAEIAEYNTAKAKVNAALNLIKNGKKEMDDAVVALKRGFTIDGEAIASDKMNRAVQKRDEYMIYLGGTIIPELDRVINGKNTEIGQLNNQKSRLVRELSRMTASSK